MSKINALLHNYSKVLILISLISGFIITTSGLLKLSKPELFSWSNLMTLGVCVGFLIITTIIVITIVKKLSVNIGLATFITATIYAIFAGVIWPLLSVLLFIISSFIFGCSILKKFKIENQTWITCFLIGSGIFGSIIGLLAHLPVNYPGVYVLLLLLPLIFNWQIVLEKIKDILESIKQNSDDKYSFNALDIIISVLVLFYFVVALMPDVGFDSLAVHLFIPSHMFLRHQWGFDFVTYAWAVMPMLGDWIYSIGYMLAGETAARFINISFIFVLAYQIKEIAKWAGSSSFGSRVAVIFFLLTPLTFTEGSTLYIESIWASFVIAGTFAVLRLCSSSEKQKFELPIIGILLGCALATKEVTFIILPALLLVIIFCYKSWAKISNSVYILCGLVILFVIGIIPYSTAWILTGNPVFPFFNSIFQSNYFPISDLSTAYSNTKMTWDILYRATFESRHYLEASAGAPGFQWLLLLIPSSLVLFFSKHKKGLSLLLIGITTIIITFHFQGYLRYIFPSLILLIIVIGIAFDLVFREKSFIKYLWAIGFIATILLNFIFLHSGNGFYKDFPILSTINESTWREQYISDHLPIKNAVGLINKINIKKTPVAVFADPLTAGLSSDELYPTWNNFTFKNAISSAKTPDDIVHILSKYNSRLIILDLNWNWIACCEDKSIKQEIIQKATEEIASFGSISVRTIKQNYLFKTEILQNPNFESTDGWTLEAGSKYIQSTESILVSEQAPAYQHIYTSPGQIYLNTVVARCLETDAIGRIQINWHDKEGHFITTNIKTFNCYSDWSDYSMEVTAPPNAYIAYVYTSGNSSTLLEFKSNSLKQ